MDGDLHKEFRRRIAGDWQRIESSITGSGIPDLNGCLPPELWIETKKTVGNAVKFQPFQVPWLQRRWRHGGRCFVAVRQVKRDADNLVLVLGRDAGLLQDQGIGPDLPCRSWQGGPSRWDWAQVHAFLTATHWDH